MSSPQGQCDRERCRAPVKRGKMTGAISLFLSLRLFSVRVVCVRVCVCVSESEYEADRKSKTGSPWGLVNQACIEQESPGGSCVRRQVSVAFWGRGYGQAHQSSPTIHTHPHRLKVPRNKTNFLLLYPFTMPLLLHIWFAFKCEILL